MANGLCENGVELHLLTINTKKHFKNDAFIPEDFKAKTHYQSVYHNTNISLSGALFNLITSESYFVSRFYFGEFEKKIIETLQKIKFDVIQLEGLFLGYYIPAIRKNSKAKIILRAHNIEHVIWNRHIANEKKWLKRLYLTLQNKRLKKFEAKIFKSVDAIVPITDTDKEYMFFMNKELKLFTCITGVDLNDYELNKNTRREENTLFYFGSMDWVPNQEAVEWFLTNCWDAILSKNPNCKFIIAGRNMPLKFKKLNLPNVVVVENVANKNEFYSKYDVMIVPLLSGSGLRIKIIEGLSFGKAIISTGIGSEGIWINNGEDLLIADTPEDFITAVDSLFVMPEKKNKLEQNAKNFARTHLDNKIITGKLVAFYKRL